MTALYRHFDSAKRLLYVGISLSAVYRLAKHRYGSSWFNEIDNVTIQRFPTRRAARDAERRAVCEENPVYNKHLRPTPPRPLRKERIILESKRRKPLNLSMSRSTKLKAFRMATEKGISISQLVTRFIEQFPEAAK